MKTKKIISSIVTVLLLLFITSLFLFSSFVFAQPQGSINNNPDGRITNGKLQNPLQYKGDIQGLLESVINDVLVPIGAIVAACFIIYSGFLFVTAQGNDEKISEAKHTFFYTIIGTLVLLGAATIAGIISNTVDQLKV